MNVMKWFLFFVVWWAILLTLVALASNAGAQPAPTEPQMASCDDVLSLEADINMVAGWQQGQRRQFKDGTIAYEWQKGQMARVLMFAPESAGLPPKGSVFQYLGRCESQGGTRLVARATLGGDKT